MKNKKLQDKLRSHKAEFNPAAWEQMDQMLESLNKPPEKKRKLFWWFFLPLFLLFGASLYLLVESDSKSSEGDVSMNLVPKESFQSNIDRINEPGSIYTPAEQPTNEIRQSSETEPKPNESKSNKKEIGFESKSTGESMIVYNNDGISEKEHSTVHDLKDSNDQSAVDGTSLNIDLERRSNDNNVKNEKTNLGQTHESELSLGNSEESSDKRSKESIRAIVLHPEILPLEYLEIDNQIKFNEDDLPGIIEGQKSKRSRYISFKGGYSLFNTNPGLYVSGGIHFPLHKVIELEAELSYVYGKGSEVNPEGLFTRENQFDLSLISHLNLVRNARHKFSLEIGLGFTQYSGKRLLPVIPPLIENRKSGGFSYQGGVSYTYFLNNGSAIGLKYGLIAYDDEIQFFAFRYLKRI